MSEHDAAVSDRAFSFGFPGRRSAGDTGAVAGVEAVHPQSFALLTKADLDQILEEFGNAAFGTALATLRGTPDFGHGDQESTFTGRAPWTQNSGVIYPVSAIADAVTNPSTFNLRVFSHFVTSGFNQGVDQVDPSGDVYGGGITGWFSRLDPDHGGANTWGSKQRPHYPNFLSIPGWAGLSGEFAETWLTDIPVPTRSGTASLDLFVGMTACRVPTESAQNPKLGTWEYVREEVVMGLKLEPVSVAVNGSGDLTFVLGNSRLFCANDVGSGTQLNHAGRTVVVYKTTPVGVTATAIQQAQIAFTGGENRVVISGGLGEGAAASTSPEDYTVVVLGPCVVEAASAPLASGLPGGVVIVGVFTRDTGATNPWWTSSSYTVAKRGIASFAKMDENGAGFFFEKLIAVASPTAPAAATTTPSVDKVYRISLRQHPDEPDTDRAWTLGDGAAWCDFAGTISGTNLDVAELIRTLGLGRLGSDTDLETARVTIPVSDGVYSPGSTFRVLLAEFDMNGLAGATVRVYYAHNVWGGSDSDYGTILNTTTKHGLEITHNAEWDHSASEWVPSAGSVDCYITRFARGSVFRGFQNVGSPTNFSDSDWDWSASTVWNTGSTHREQTWSPDAVIYTHLTSNNEANPDVATKPPKNAILSGLMPKAWATLFLDTAEGDAADVLLDGIGVDTAITSTGGTRYVIVETFFDFENTSALSPVVNVGSATIGAYATHNIAANQIRIHFFNRATGATVDAGALGSTIVVDLQVMGRILNDGTNT